MEWTEVVSKLFDLCIVPLLGLVTMYLSLWLKSKIANLQKKTETHSAQKSLDVLNVIVENCILATNQTYVEPLKEKGIFDDVAKKMAFELTYNAINSNLTKETKDSLSKITADLDKYIRDLIEAKINSIKKGNN